MVESINSHDPLNTEQKVVSDESSKTADNPLEKSLEIDQDQDQDSKHNSSCDPVPTDYPFEPQSEELMRLRWIWRH